MNATTALLHLTARKIPITRAALRAAWRDADEETKAAIELVAQYHKWMPVTEQYRRLYQVQEEQ